VPNRPVSVVPQPLVRRVPVPELQPPTIDEIVAARERLGDSVARTELVRLDIDSPHEILLKLENRQPIGSFKIRGALNAMRRLPREALRDGVYTASAGNMAQGVAWGARELGIRCTVLVPDTAAQTKLEAIARLGADIVKLTFDEWWRTMEEHGDPAMKGTFIHPVSNRDVIAGNGTVGEEIAEQLNDIDEVYVPYGGGGLSCGIATSLARRSPRTRVWGVEVSSAAPLAASLAAGRPVSIEHRASWVSGIGGKSVLAEMWPLASTLLAGARVVSLEQVEDALFLLSLRQQLVVEGAGAAPVAAALHSDASPRRVVCVVTGGNIDEDVYREVMSRAHSRHTHGSRIVPGRSP
jgi:threonine dehydratase